jgi:hypothetical protein
MAKSLWNRWFKAKSKPARRAPRRPARSSLLLEPLEDRRVPTVLFTPVFSGTAVTGNDPSQSLSSPHVDLIFAGSYWNTTQGVTDRANVTLSVQEIVSSPYLSDLTQYGSDGKALFDPTNATSQTNNTPTLNDVKNTVPNFLTLRSFIQNQVPTVNSNTIYCVINDPQHSNLGVPGGAGANNIFPNFFFPGVHGIYVNTKFSTQSDGTQVVNEDLFTQFYSHELAENTVPAISVSDPGKLNLGTQICDNEPENFVPYDYRLNGALVQAYWSQLDNNALGGWVVPDGNGRVVTLNATNPQQPDGTYNLLVNVPGLPGLGPVTNNFDLNADANNEFINLRDRGQVFVFPLAQLKKVDIDLGSLAGTNTVDVERTSSLFPVNIQLSGGSTSVVTISPFSKSLEAIQGNVTVNSSGSSGERCET